jgi:hypothetical protein
LACPPKRTGQRKNLRRIATIAAKENKATEGVMSYRHPFFGAQFLAADTDHEHLSDFFS